jgi:hypothetical protein
MISSDDLQRWRTARQWKQFLTPHIKEMHCMDLKITANLRMKPADSFMIKIFFFVATFKAVAIMAKVT